MNKQSLFYRARSYLRARRNARLFGLKYHRARDFKLPNEIIIDGKRVSIQHLGTPGTRADFFVCLIYDNYKLRNLSQRRLKSIVDIGANQGFFSLAARAFNPNATIFCYEPNDRLAEVLHHNCSLSRANVYFEAVGSTRGTCRLKLSSESNQTTTELLSEGFEGVPQVSLHDVVSRAGGEISLLKLDCEGAEWDIMESNAMSFVNAISMEYHLGKSSSLSHEDAVQRVQNLGFAPVHVSRGKSTGDIVAVRDTS